MNTRLTHAARAAGVRVAPDRMSFDDLPHTATLGDQGWQVSWLPDRDNLTAEEARDALVVARLSNTHRVRAYARRDWPQIKTLALGIGVDPREAVKLVRTAEAEAHKTAIPTPAQQIPHLAAAAPRRPETADRLVSVDAPAPPTVRTPGRVPGQWLGSGGFLEQERGLDR